MGSGIEGQHPEVPHARRARAERDRWRDRPGFHVDAISKENQRQDFIKANGGVDSRPGPGVAQVGPQCHGAAQCAQYLDIRNGRDNSYNLMTGFYAGSAALLFVSAVFYLQTRIDVSAESKTGSLVPMIGPQIAGASWEARF